MSNEIDQKRKQFKELKIDSKMMNELLDKSKFIKINFNIIQKIEDNYISQENQQILIFF